MNDLEAESIRASLATTRLGRSLHIVPETGSTNDDARAAAIGGAPAGHVIVADAQTRGRGAHGRTWSSPRGVDLYLSIVERLPIEPARIAPLTLAVGLGVSDAVREIAGLDARVKWPNDVWIDRRKCAGILCEASSVGARIDAIVIGIGLGVNRASYEGELAESATSLRIASARVQDRARVLGVLLSRVEEWIDRFVAMGPAPIVAALEPRLALAGERVRVDDLEGTLVGIAPSGALRLETSDGLRELVAGTLRPA